MTATLPAAPAAVAPVAAPARVSLFDLAGDAFRLEARIAEAAEGLVSDDPEVAAASVEQIEALLADQADNRDALMAKADAWCWAIERIRAHAAARAEHARRLRELAAEDERKADTLQERLIQQLLFLEPDATRFDLASHKLTSLRSEVVELAQDVEPIDLPEQFQRVKTTVDADKVALKGALKAGTEVEGVALVERRSWAIR